MERGQGYSRAISALNSLQASTLSSNSVAAKDFSRRQNIAKMVNYLKRCDVEVEDLSRLSIIHISGTKGKGSTSAFCESILRHHGFTTGMYSSPHLISVRERIRLNSKPIDEDLFSKYFWEVYTKLDATKDHVTNPHIPPMPTYFQIMTVLAFYVFLKENLDAIVLEVGIGGEYDPTNIIPRPIVCGVVSLGIDHCMMLGDTIEKIAWQKSGIFKPFVPAVTIPQQAKEAEDVLCQRAIEKGTKLYMAPPLGSYDCGKDQIHLGIAGCKQPLNATLALQLCRIWIANHGKDQNEWKWVTDQPDASASNTIPELDSFKLCNEMMTGLAECFWPGRNQIVKRPGVTYYLDGGHTPESVQHGADYFAEASVKDRKTIEGDVYRVLVFNVARTRNPTPLLAILNKIGFDAAVFCPNLAYTGGNDPEQHYNIYPNELQLSISLGNKEIWDNMNTTVDGELVESQSVGSNLGIRLARKDTQGSVESHAFPCIQQCLYWASQGRDIVVKPMNKDDIPSLSPRLQSCSHIQVLVTGSLHLVGLALGLLDVKLA